MPFDFLTDVPDAVRERAARVRLVAFDVDGTLTDGKVVFAGKREVQSFCVLDGQAITWLVDMGFVVAWISGRGCPATEKRARGLGVTELHLRVGSKEDVLARIQDRTGIGVDQTVAMGDDLPDLGLAQRATVFACPAGARAEVKARAHLVTNAAAGSGAVRELVETTLRAKGLWQALLERYSPTSG